MIDPGQPVRKAFFDALNNQVNNPEQPTNKIPIVDEKLDLLLSEHDLYILIGNQSDSPGGVKTVWASEVDLTLTVVNRRKATNSKTLIENIITQIYQILFPTRTSFGITISNPFKLSYVKKMPAAEYGFEKTADGWQVIKSVPFRTRIIQNI
jgi:hypothetical protein